MNYPLQTVQHGLKPHNKRNEIMTLLENFYFTKDDYLENIILYLKIMKEKCYKDLRMITIN